MQEWAVGTQSTIRLPTLAHAGVHRCTQHCLVAGERVSAKLLALIRTYMHTCQKVHMCVCVCVLKHVYTSFHPYMDKYTCGGPNTSLNATQDLSIPHA